VSCSVSYKYIRTIINGYIRARASYVHRRHYPLYADDFPQNSFRNKKTILPYIRGYCSKRFWNRTSISKLMEVLMKNSFLIKRQYRINNFSRFSRKLNETILLRFVLLVEISFFFIETIYNKEKYL
jgi:hypothetical protein